MLGFVFLGLGLLVAAAVGVGWWRRQARRQRHARAVAERLTERFPVADMGEGEDAAVGAAPLRSPPGWVLVRSEGLCVRLGAEGPFRQVPWQALGSVVPEPGGVCIHVSGVGDLRLPSSAGRELWDAVRAWDTAEHGDLSLA